MEAGFTVGEDFSVTDPNLYDAGTAALRQAQAETFATDLRAKVGTLVSTDADIATQLTAATTGLGSEVFPESGDNSDGVQVVDYKTAPTPLPGPPDDPVNDRAPNADYPGRDARGRFLPGNTGSADGAAAAEQRLQEYEKDRNTTVIRQQIRVAVVDPATGQPMTDPKTGKPLYRYYDGLAPTSTPGQYIGIEVKSGSADLTRQQKVFDGRVSPQTPAIGVLNGQPVKVVDTRLLNTPGLAPGDAAPGNAVPQTVPRTAPEPLPKAPPKVPIVESLPKAPVFEPRLGGVLPDDAMPHFVDLPGHLAGAPDGPILGDGRPDHDR